MDELFGIPIERYMIGGLVLMSIAFGVVGWIAWRQPLLVRMGLRNAVRRRTQTTLIVIGLMLSTLIISAAFATGDTVGYSITNAVYKGFAQADIVIVRDTQRVMPTEMRPGRGPARQPGSQAGDPQARLIPAADLDRLKAMLAGNPDVDGIAGVLQEDVPALNGARRLSEPNAVIAGVDPADVDPFNSILAPDGARLRAADLKPGAAYISERLARDISLAVGDQVTVYVNNQPSTLTVQAIVQDNALTSRQAEQGQQPAGGLLVQREVLESLTGRTNGYSLIAVSVRGGVRDSLDAIERVATPLEAQLKAADGPALQIVTTKADQVKLAELIGSVFVTFFLVFGLFSIAAGIMLIFLTFVMLAAERRAEMGMARAVGMKRLHLTEMFIAEGMAYNVGSALVGAILGLGVALILVTVMGQIVSSLGFEITFHVNPQGFIISYALGIVLTFATVAFSSWRAANLNIVRAIRDLPEPQPLRGRDRTLSGLFRASVGVGWYLIWLLLLSLGVVVGVQAFIFGLGYFGLPFLVYLAMAAFYLFGARGASRIALWLPPRGVTRYLAAVLTVPTLPLRVFEGAWRSLRGDGRLITRIGRAAWWIGFSAPALATWGLLRTRGWANHHRNAGGWAIWMIVIGLGLTWWGGWEAQQAFAYTGGTTLALLAMAMLAVYFGMAPRPAFTVVSIVLLWYWLLPLPFSLLFEEGKGWSDPLNGLAALVRLDHAAVKGNIEMFFVSGICITAASTIFVTFNADLLLGVLRLGSGLFGGIAPAVRTAVAYPLAAKFRTAMTLAMFGLVVFSLVVMATLNYNFTQLFLGRQAEGGFDVAVRANPNNRIDDLSKVLVDSGYDPARDISGIASLRLSTAEMGVPGAEQAKTGEYRIAGIDDTFMRLATIPIAARAAGYASDEALFAAMRADPTLALLDESRLSANQNAQFGGPAQRFSIPGDLKTLRDQPWEPIPVTVRDAGSGQSTEVRVIGIVEAQFSGVILEWQSLMVSRTLLDREFAGGQADFFYLTLRDGSPGGEKHVADEVEGALLERGVQATSIEERISDTAAQSQGFQMLFQAFMGLGLIVGIAALGVIAFRTVAERRQQIGMLRAIGYTRRLVALSFFLESSFIALTGVGTGLVLGAALSYNLLTSPDFTNGVAIDFAIPWVRLIIIVSIAYGASALMTLIPARSASRVAVAEALRYNG